MLPPVHIFIIVLILIFIFALYIQVSSRSVQVLGGGSTGPVGFVLGEDKPGVKNVVFMAGLGNSHELWEKVQVPVAESTRTLSFDYLGVGQSEINPSELDILPKSFNEVCDQVHSLVIEHSIKTPFLLVGHSIGGALALTYAKKYPDDVDSLILLDPTLKWLLEEGPDFYTKTGQHPNFHKWELDMTRRYLENYCKSADQIPEVPPDIPIIIHYNIDDSDKRAEKYEKSLKEYFGLPKNSLARHENKTHFIHLNDPKVIIDSIISKIEKVD